MFELQYENVFTKLQGEQEEEYRAYVLQRHGAALNKQKNENVLDELEESYKQEQMEKMRKQERLK